MTDFHDSTSTPTDMPKLHVINNTVYATSIEVAEYFGKRHDNVLRTIDNLGCSEKITTLGFKQDLYIDAKGEKRRMYRMTYDGFTLLTARFMGRKPAFGTEREVQVRLAESLENPRLEVLTPAGEIDILTNSEVIEIKPAKYWKHAIGQVIVYADYYPTHRMRIHLFGEICTNLAEVIREHCSKHGIRVTFDSIPENIG